MAYLETCSAVRGVVITQPGPNSLNVKWTGVATTYKLAVRRQEDITLPYTTFDMQGPGSSGGSGIDTDDTGGVTTPGADNPSADFTVPDLLPGLYDLRLFNICADASTHERFEKALLKIDVGEIPNFRLLSKSEAEISVAWDTPTIDSGEPFYVSWCELNHLGHAIVCDSALVDNAAREYKIPFPTANRYRVWVSQFHNEWQAATSDPVLLYLCKCSGAGEASFSASGHYIHDQATAAAVWTVNHGLGFYPNVNITNHSGQEIGGVVVFIDENNFEVRFGTPVSGYAYYE